MSGKPKEKNKKICVVCGGSAGHIFPALALAEEIKNIYADRAELLFVTSENRLALDILKKSAFAFRTLPLHRKEARPFGGGTGSLFQDLRRGALFVSGLIKAFFRSAMIIFRFRPDCIVCFGSYIAVPPFAAGLIMGAPILIHEQNAVMGRANRLMSRFADKVALSFPAEAVSRNAVVTGNPVRQRAAGAREKSDALALLGLRCDRLTLLVIGGSQGSRTVNEAVIGMFREMGADLKKGLQVIHLCGDRDRENLEGGYGALDVLCRVYPFFEDMGLLYSAADISISRAGASVICELCAHRMPAVLVPYPYAGGHQLRNARFLEKRQAAVVAEESGLLKMSLLRHTQTLVSDEGARKRMGEKIGAVVSPDSGRRLALQAGALAGLDLR